MDELIKKISSYNLFNYLFPGILFVIISNKFLGYNLEQENIIFGFFVYYFVGLIISRLGSLIIEPLFKKIKIVEFSEYKDFLKAEKKDEKIGELLESANMYRTIISVILVVLFLWIYKMISFIFPIILDYTNVIIIIFLLFLFIFSYKKQVEYISSRVSYFKKIKSKKGSK